MKKPGSRPARKRGRPVSADTRHRVIAEDILERIRTDEWPNGTVLPSRGALARMYGAGLGAIQLAIESLKAEGHLALSPRRRLIVRENRTRGAEPSRRVLEIMSANPMVYLRSRDYAELQHGITIGAGELFSPLHLVFDVEFRKTVPHNLLSDPLRGILIVGKVAGPALREYEALNVPVVLVDRPKTRWKLHTAGADNKAATFDAVRRLHEAGHRRIAILRRILLDTREVEPDSEDRQRSFVRAMRTIVGIDARDSVYSFFPRDTSSAPGIQHLLTARPPYTAAIACDESSAQTLIAAAREEGLSVPRDLSVVSFGTRRTVSLGISGPRVNMEEIGRQAVHLLEDPGSKPTHVLIPAEWQDGGTMGPPPKAAGK